MVAEAHDQQSLLSSLGSLPIAMVVSNPRRPDNPLEIVNPAFCLLTGYSEDDVIGHNCRFLAGSGTDAQASRSLRAAIHSRVPALIDILNYRKSGEPFRNGVMITPLLGPDGEPEWFLGSQVELGQSSPLALRRTDAAGHVAGLAPRQRQVLELMARGLLNKQIAWQLKISEKTVKMHRALLIDRLGVSSSAEAIRIAVEAGL